MSDLEARIRAIEDRDAIRELTGRYCLAVVKRDARGIADLFTADGEMVMGETVNRGTAKLVTSYESTLAEMQPKPCVHNHVVELDGDRATGTCAVELRFVNDGAPWIASGHYEDAYARVDGAWRFARRELLVYHWVALDTGWTADPLR